MAGNYGYPGVTYVYRVRSSNGGVAWFVAASPGEAVDQYWAMRSPTLDQFQTEGVEVVIVAATQNITSDASAGASSGITQTAAAWATAYTAGVAAGLSATGSSVGVQRLLSRSS